MATPEPTIDVSLMKWAIGGLAAFILILIAWIKALIKKVDDTNDARIADLKETAAVVRGHTRPLRGEKEESDE